MISFEDVCNEELDLVVDEIYEGGNKGNISDEVISKLLNVGNTGGIRTRNIDKTDEKAYIVLYTTGEDQDWPDTLDIETGKFKYYGDNKTPGAKVTDTVQRGNLILEQLFNETNHMNIPPVFIFQKAITENSNRSVRFLGLAVPEDYHLGKDESLKAIWRTTNNRRFINYESHFTILDTKLIKKEWLYALERNDSDKDNYAPKAWIKYLSKGLSEDIILKAPKTKEYRTKREQLPDSIDSAKLEMIYEYYKDNPFRFEYFAASLVELMDSNFLTFDVTRPTRDGGIDAIGTYKIGHNNNSIKLRCIVEAKCYSRDSGNGVSMLSRLISRLRFRNFGVFVTTSYVSEQAYKEILEDEHPIIIISGGDIIEILRSHHIITEEEIGEFMERIDYSLN